MLRSFDMPKLVGGLVKLHFLREGEVDLGRDQIVLVE
jgi:hypothetical protein